MVNPIEWFIADEEYSHSCEQENSWFMGSLITEKRLSVDFRRLSIIHNWVTHEETHFDDRFKTNMRIAAQLSEYFPFKWLTEITAAFRTLNARKLGIKTYEDRLASYIGYIEIFLTFRGLTLSDTTLDEINISLNVKLTRDVIRSWKLKILRLDNSLREKWIKVRAQNHQAAILSTVIQVMNQELNLDSCSKEENFHIKQTCLLIARQFVASKRSVHIKKPEVWARAICLKAFRSITPDFSHSPFPHLSPNTLKVINHKRWHLDQLFKNSAKI
ncbi:MAG: hypothetical protein ACXACK_18740 [Candidatus Hodarchaeales archaeon]